MSLKFFAKILAQEIVCEVGKQYQKQKRKKRVPKSKSANKKYNPRK